MSRAARAYVADVERKDPRTRSAKVLNGEYARAAVKRRAFTVHVNRQVAVQVDKKAQVTRDAAAYDAMTGARPLKPPCALPVNAPQVRSVGSRGLERERPHKVPALRWTGEGWKL